MLLNPTLREVGERILVWQPNIVYFSGDSHKLPANGKLPTLSWRTTEEQGTDPTSDRSSRIARFGFQNMHLEELVPPSA